MNRDRWICLSGLILCLVVGGYLRLAGADWGSGAPRSHRGMYAHPDERSVYDKTGRLEWKTVGRAAGESRIDWFAKSYAENFLDPQSGMNIDSFNYGSFPYYVLYAASNLFNAYSPTEMRTRILLFAGAFFLIAVLFWTALQIPSVNRSGWTVSGTLMGGVLLGGAVVMTASWLLAGYAFKLGTGVEWAYQTWGKLGRPLSGVAGTMTIYYLYRTGARLYGRRVGLFAAILLTFTALHLQLSHYFTFDVIQAFFCTAAVYSLMVFVDAETWGGRWRSMAAASIWTGLGMSTKFGSILLFIPWIAAFGLAYWRHRPKLGLYRRPSILFAMHLKAIGLLSFLLIWATTFFTQPFGYLDYAPIDRNARPAQAAAESAPAELSFVHLNFAAGPGFLPSGLREKLAALGDRIDPITSKIGVHFGWLDHHPLNPAHQDWLAIGGSRYWRDVTEQRRMALEGGFPWTRQYKNTTPFLYQWKNLILWGMGVPLGLLCFFGLFYGFGAPFYRPTWTEWVVLAWMVPNFFSTHLFLTKFPRYLTPQLPYFCLWGAAAAVALAVWLKRRESRSRPRSLPLSRWVAIGCVAATAWSALYSFAYLKVFTGTHPWETASDWFQENVPAGKRVISESWDDPVPTDPGVMRLYEHRTTNPIHSDAPQHLLTVFRQMETADYYCFSSKRNYGAFLQAPEDGPNRVRFYQSLFAGNLGFRLVKTFSQPVTVLGVPIRFELADESLSLYDHPTVHVFEKAENLKDHEMLQRVLNPPDWVADLTKEQILTATEDRSLLASHGSYAMERWLLGVMLVGWVFWPIAFFLFRASPDGGLFAAKTIGLLLLTYLSWLGTNLGWWENTRLATTLALILWAALSGYCLSRAGRQMKEFLRGNWKKVLFAEAVFLVVFAYFISVRMANPDIYWGEKPMNIAFINAAYQANTFPAVDPWYAGVPINYYHYGHFAIALFGKWVGVPPEYAYNLACGTWPALVFCLVFGMVFNLTRSKLGGLVAGFLAVMAGNVKSVIQLASQFNGGPVEPKVFREGYIPGGLGAYFSEVYEQIALSMGQVGWIFWKSPLFERVGKAFVAWLDPAQVEAAAAGQLPRVLSFDAYFWKLSRITKSSVANEFPGWTHFFADLHAHQIGMPIAMVSLALIIAFFQRKVGMWKLESEGRFSDSHAQYGSPLVCLLQTVFLGLFLGIVFVSNAWDYPGLFGLFSLALLLFYLIYRREWLLSVRWGFGRSIVRLGVGGRSMRNFAALKLGFLREVALPTISVACLGYAFLYPFHRHFHPPQRVGGIGWMHEAASGWTTPYEFVQIFGIFLVLIVFGLAVLYWRWSVSPFKSWAAILGTLVSSFLLALLSARFLRGLASRSAGIAEGSVLPSNRDSVMFWRMLDAEIAYLVFALAFFLLLLLVPFLFGRRTCVSTRLGAMVLGLGLAIIAGVEVVYINENWSAPLHRWNTAFKFHLQAWLCLSVGVGWLVGVWLNQPADPPRVAARTIGRACRYVFGYPLLLVTLSLAAVYPMVAPYVFTYGEGFTFRTRHVEGDFTLDGLNFLRKKHPDYAAAIDYLRARVDGQQAIVEVDGESYSHDRGWVATHTGLPTLIGWPHHSRERDNLPEPRIELVRTIYTSTSRERVRDILREHRIRFVVVGPTEKKFYPMEEGFRKFEEWKDLFYPAFTSSIEKPGVTLYAVHPHYQLDEDWAPPVKAAEETTLFRSETGRPLLRGGVGYGGGEYREPRGIVLTPDGAARVADSMNHRIQGFDPSGALKWLLGEEGGEEAQFKEPRDLAVDEEGRLHILDTWNSRIQIFSATGDLLSIHPVPGGANGVAVGRVPIAGPDPENGGLNLPEVPMLGPPMTFVANTAGRNIVVLNRKGEQTQAWGGGLLLEPVDVEVTPLGLAVADSRARKILLFDGRGRVLEEWAIPTEETGGQTNEIKLFWDEPRRRLFVTDPAHDRLLVLSDRGETLLETPVRGGPAGVAVTGDGRVFISAKGEGRILLVPIPTEH